MSDGNSISVILQRAAARLGAVSDSPRLDAELLLARAIDMPRSFLFAHPDAELDDGAIARLDATVARRLDGEPLAYICGEKEFWSLRLMVTADTLVPRPETELLVEQALSRLPRRAALRVLDLGTGSGAIALALARERPLCQVTATDVSAAALAVARLNARQLELPNVEFVAGSWCEPLAGREFDLVVSNPPYVADDDPALAGLRHEPRAALAAGADGLDDIRTLARDVRDIAVPGGTLLLEHGAGQATAVAEILVAAGWLSVGNVKDLAGRPRVTSADAPGEPLARDAIPNR